MPHDEGESTLKHNSSQASENHHQEDVDGCLDEGVDEDKSGDDIATNPNPKAIAYFPRGAYRLIMV